MEHDMTDTNSPVIEVAPTTFEHLTTELMAALVKAQQQAESAAKDGKTQHQSRSYTSTDAISRAAKQAFAGTGLAWWHEPLTHEAATDRLIMRWHLWHEKGGRISGESRISHWQMQGMSAPQSRGAVASYARKYALTAILLLDRDDGDAAVEEPSRGRDRREHRSNRRVERDRPAPASGSNVGIKVAHEEWKKALTVHLAAIEQHRGEEPHWREVMDAISVRLGLTAWPKRPDVRTLKVATEALRKATRALHEADGPPEDGGPEPYDPGDEPNDQPRPDDDGAPL